MFKIHAIGGYGEVGKNMTAVEIGEDIILFDCGLYLPAVVDLQESTKTPSAKLLESVGAFPNDRVLEGKRDKVRAILIGHAHLDHVGAVQYIANRYPNAQIYGTPFTIAVLNSLIDDGKHFIKNKINIVAPNSSVNIKGKNGNYKADFINITHSTPQTSIIALDTNHGIVVYANDFKLDNNPVIGLPPNYDKMKEIAKKGVKVLIMDSLYSGSERKTPSEKIARALVEEVLLTVNHEGHGIIITTFSSHIARLKSIVDFSKKLNRKIIFVGRSLSKYVNAAKTAKICPFEKEIELATYPNQLEKKLKLAEKNRESYVIVCTGHQAEPGSILDRMVEGKLPFKLRPHDSVIFSAKVIPVPINISARANLDKKIRKKDVRIFDEVHVSGHGGSEDLRETIELLKPENIIPSHGSLDQLSPAVELAKEMGYEFGKNIHLVQDGTTIEVK